MCPEKSVQGQSEKFRLRQGWDWCIVGLSESLSALNVVYPCKGDMENKVCTIELFARFPK